MDNDDDKTQTHVVLTKGMMVSHYRIIEKIGAGGMGEIFLAEDTELKRNVALKFLPPQLCQDEDCRSRFKREAQAVAKLDHPNIVTVYEVSEYKGRPFFAMQHVEGQSLKDLIKDAELSLEKTINLAKQICEGLDKAHQAGIIHRDIKPSNVVIDADGRPKLLDFGLATIKGTDRLTKTGSTLGTVGYMSPEQIRGEESDNRSDLFSFGVVLYEMITGHRPFEAEHDAAIHFNIVNESPEPLTRFKKDIPDDLQRLIDKLLEKDPKLRYQSAAGIVSDLRRLLAPSQSSIVALPSQRKSRWLLWAGIGAVAIVIIAILGWQFRQTDKQQAKTDARKMLAVLPFENLGAPEDEYFADGITDAINTRLASIHSLGVISRTSTMAYKNSEKRLPEIAKELGVDYILEGTILWDKSKEIDRVRIIPQLIEVSTDLHLWAAELDREITDLFAVQAEIATKITEELGLTLLEPEKKLIQTKPTDNLEAYHYYLRGMELWNERISPDRAIKMFERAVDTDSGFYQAHRMLAQLYGYMHINNMCSADSCLEKAKFSAERALQLAAGNPEGYVAMGYFHYYCSRDYDRALELFEKAFTKQPNNTSLLNAIAYVKRRQGLWDDALTSLQKAYQLDPRNLSTVDALARTMYKMHLPHETRELIADCLLWAPDNLILLIWNMALVGLTTNNFDSLLIAQNRFEQSAERWVFNFWAENMDILRRDYDKALSRREKPGDYSLSDSAEFYATRASIFDYMGNKTLSRAYYDSLRLMSEPKVKEFPDNHSFHLDLAEAYAGLGRKEEAIREGKIALELMPVSKDAMDGPNVMLSMANIYIMTEEYEKAIDLLDYLLANPSMLQVGMMKIYPGYDSLRDHPRFQALIEKYSRDIK
jgi:serine/threonine protein kinase/Flp pilus assembly protein TadD